MKYRLSIFLLSLVIGFSACDDGDIEEKNTYYKEGRIVKLTGNLSGIQNWPNDFSVCLAGFDGIDDYAIISKQIPQNTEGAFTLVLAGINDNVTNIQLCVLDRLRRHVMTFKEIIIPVTRDTIYMQVGTVDVSMFNAIQQCYFNTTCVSCHGASNHAAAGLYLTEGRSYQALVGVKSKKVTDAWLVEPGNIEGSLLHQVLSQNQIEGIAMSHHDLVSEKNAQSTIPLIDSWIANGAKEK